jgi:hypothetical protein
MTSKATQAVRFALLTTGLFTTGCSLGGEPRFVRAEVRNIVPGAANVAPIQVTGEELTRLLSFFPRVGTGRRNALSGGWIAGLEIRFVRPSGRAAVVTTDTALRYWTEEHGDWVLDEDFRPFIGELFESHALRPLASTGRADTAAIRHR